MATETRPTPNNEEPFRKIIDSTAILAISRFAWPVVLAMLGYLGATQLSDLKEGQKTGLSELRSGQQIQWSQISKMVEAQTVTGNVQSGLVAQLGGVTKQLDHLQIQVDTLSSKVSSSNR